MSTRATIKYGDGYHLFRDHLDEYETHVLLELAVDDVEVETNGGKTEVTIKITNAMAAALGLIPVGPGEKN